MEKFLPYFTNDGSVGLFSEEFDDVYHSASGALSEAFEKFVLPVIGLKNDNYKILDICFGLGYNSKAFISHLGVDKNIDIDILDIDKNLIFLSPLIKTNGNNKNNKKTLRHFTEEQKKIINKYSKSNLLQKYKIKKDVNEILIKNLYETFSDEFINFINSKDVMKFSSFFELNIQKFIKNYRKFRLFYTPEGKKRGFLHNIYYPHVSKRYKCLLNSSIKMNFYIDDARNSIKKLNNETYDVVFLDAFTTRKCPQLWSIDFINEIAKKTKYDTLVVTYSTATIVRNTFKQAGFYVGKIIYNNKAIGTICSKNKSLLKNPLSDYEMGLLNTKAGIPYRDEGLNNTKEDILLTREYDVANSNLSSSSKYLKNKGCTNEI